MSSFCVSHTARMNSEYNPPNQLSYSNAFLTYLNLANLTLSYLSVLYTDICITKVT